MHSGVGTVATKDIPLNSVVAENHGRVIRAFAEYADKCKAITDRYSWNKDTPVSKLKKLGKVIFEEMRNSKSKLRT